MSTEFQAVFWRNIWESQILTLQEGMRVHLYFPHLDKNASVLKITDENSNKSTLTARSLLDLVKNHNATIIPDLHDDLTRLIILSQFGFHYRLTAQYHNSTINFRIEQAMLRSEPYASVEYLPVTEWQPNEPAALIDAIHSLSFIRKKIN